MKITGSFIPQRYDNIVFIDNDSFVNHISVYFLQSQQWIPSPATVVQLLESYTNEKECSLLTLDWVCPGRKETQSGELEGDAESEEQKQKII